MIKIDKKLGYYTCNGIDFESKLLASMHSLKVGQPVKWNFNDEVFSAFDWTKEPSESLDALYDRRARDLREKYDYLILSYSGGADSHNVLMSFLRQGLYFDEILVNTLEKGWKNYTIIDLNNKSCYNQGAEHYLQTVPRLKELEPLMPKTKITICDLTDNVYDSFLKVGDASWVMNKREALNPLGVTRYNYIYFNEVRKNFDKEKVIGMVLGVEKPKSMIYDNKFYMRFNDRSANMVSIIDHVKDYDNTVLEYFYWSPDSVPILIKQGHVLKRWLEMNPQYHQYWEFGKSDFKTMRTYHERLLRSVMYPTTWNDNWFQVDKAVRDWYSEFDNWFIDGAKDTKAGHIWREGVEYIRDTLTPLLKMDQESKEFDGLTQFFKSYLIGDMSTRNL